MNNHIHDLKDSKTVIEEKFDKLYKKLLRKRVVRICIYIEFIIFYPGLILAIIIANDFNPEGFNFISNYISNLGSLEFTPLPYIFNTIVILTGIITFPIFLYLEEYLSSNLPKKYKINLSSKSTSILARLGKILFLLGAIGMVCVGIFTEDFSLPFIHIIVSTMAFGGFTLGGVISGFIIIVQKTTFPTVLGYYMTIYSLVLIILRIFHFIPIITYPLIEWSWFLGILIWLIPLTLILLNNIIHPFK